MDTLGTPTNPFSDPRSLQQSNACRPEGKGLVRDLDGAEPSRMTAFVHESFRALVLNEHFSCVGAKAAVRANAYRFGLYAPLGSEDAVAGLARDLCAFTRDSSLAAARFTSFVAAFEGPFGLPEPAFESLLWTTLQQLHDVDADLHHWNPAVSAEPSDPNFSFSFAAIAFFIVGLHAASARATRRFAWPTLVFNPHEQFDALRRSGHYAGFQRTIRAVEQDLQGSVNPMLATFGERSEARQYSGRAVDDQWQCPFRARGHGREEP